jgi:glycine oxidase
MPDQSHPIHGAKPSVAIVGGGVIGLSVGWRLAQAGCRVALYERDRTGRGASWAAAGMLAAGVETEPGEQALLGLNRTSQSLWPDFAAEIEAASGLSVDLRSDGTLRVALNRDDAEILKSIVAFQLPLGIELEWLSGAEARRREPYLSPQTTAAVFSRLDHQVDNRKLVEALRQAYLAVGGALHEQAPVEAIVVENGRARGVRVAGEIRAADIVLLAAGAWSRLCGGLPDDAVPPIRPIKGQMLALRMNPAEPLLTRVLWTPRSYLVPRRDGRLLIGASVEERGFDTDLTAGAVFALLESAWRALPAIEELPIDEMWVGFRPGSRDDAPLLGFSSVEGLVIATGHHRNGILLTPITANAISRLILTGEVDPAIADFSPGRFAARPTPASALAKEAGRPASRPGSSLVKVQA